MQSLKPAMAISFWAIDAKKGSRSTLQMWKVSLGGTTLLSVEANKIAE
jgi:hypothetical protein